MRKIHLTIGIVLMLGMILLANVVIYEALLRIAPEFFSPLIFKLILALLSLGFIASFLIGRRHANIFIRTFYVVTTVWFGLGIYLFLSLLTYLILVVYTGKDLRLIGFLAILVPVLITLYGLTHARKMRLKTIKVGLPGLPNVWQGRTAVWISDVHIGQVYREKYVRKIVEMINEARPDLLFIGGDLFDGVSTEKVINFADPLKDIIAPLGKFFVSGNHELYGIEQDFYRKIEELGIRILKNEKIELDGVQIVGIGYSKEAKKEGLKKILTNLMIDKNKPSILLKHEPSDLKIAEEAGISFQISGHTHKAQQWPLNYYAKIFYHQFVYGLKRHGRMTVYTSSGAGTWGPSIRVGSQCEIVKIIF